MDNCTGVPATDSSAATFIVADAANGLIGDTYWRRRYMSYETDGSFSKPRTGDWWAHAGVQGPTLRAGVGEALRVRLLNKGRFPASIYLQGIPLDSVSRVVVSTNANNVPLYNLVTTTVSFFATALAPTSSTASLSDAFSTGARNSVCTGTECATLPATSLFVAPDEALEFTWTVPAKAGPQGSDTSVGHLYSALEYNGHTDPGLAGVLVVGRSATTPANVKAERLAIFSVSMESDSPYLPLNVLDFVWRARAKAGAAAAVPGADANAIAAVAVARRAAVPSAPQVPVPAAVSPAELLAALYNSVSARSIDATNPAIVSALGAADALPASLPASLLGVSLGATGATLYAGTLLGASETAYHLLDASSFVAVHGQRALEAALGPLALLALEAETGFDADLFAESNTMHGLNGLLYCNRAALPGAELLTAFLGATTRWYTAVLGTEVDLHAAHWHGNTVVEAGGFRTDSVALLPRQIATVDMRAHAPGNWLFHCHITDHIDAGMLAIYEAIAAPGDADATARYSPVFADASSALPSPPPALAAELKGGRLREYFLQVEIGNWSYLSGAVATRATETAGSTACGDVDLTALDARHNGQFTWPKARFVRYTDATFTQRWVADADEATRWAHLALLGPLLRGEVGDTMRVTLRNTAPVPFSLHPHGVVYAKGSEGAPYADGTQNTRDKGDDALQPGETWPYTWFLTEASGPMQNDPSAIPWLYHGHVHEASDENTGLLGVLLVTRRGAARVPGSAVEANLRPADVDREFIVMAKVFSEGGASDEVHEHLNHAKGSEVSATNADLTDFFALNGLLACRLSLTANAGERVRLYGVSLGNEIDLHTLGFSGHALSFRGKRQSGLSLIPGTMYAADTVAAGGGGWLLQNGVISHAEKGMVARFNVVGASSALAAPAAGVERNYFIAAEQVEWDYAPAGTDLCVTDAFKKTSDAFPPLAADYSDSYGTDLLGFSDSVRTFVERILGDPTGNAVRIGRRYRKARYVGFADAGFRAPFVDAHNSSTGLLGPALRAVPGDTLRIVLRNNLAFPVNLAFPASPLILARLRERAVGAAAWGADIPGTPAELAARELAPGNEAEATWSVPTTAGPGTADAPTIAWAYSSTVSATHLYAGLAGGLIVGATPAALVPGSAAHGAEREYLLAWFISNENRSPYHDFNKNNAAAAARRASAAGGLRAPRAASASADDASADDGLADYEESNLMHAVSGRLACNLGGLIATRGEHVRFHMLGLGAELDMHTPQTHGYLAATAGGSYASAVSVHPGTRATITIKARTGGKWLLECGVNDHWNAGMRALLDIAEPTGAAATDPVAEARRREE